MSKLEIEAWQRVAGLAQSPSHDYRHIERVQDFADQLGHILGADTKLVRLAAILHDLGRSDETRRHGMASLEASKEMAEEILSLLELSDQDRRIVVEAIETHDQPSLSPDLTEGRILKDADFLSGFGAWGVLRIAMWSGETGRRIDDVIQRMTQGMRKRLENLEYPESREAALREVLFARQFQCLLDRPARIQLREDKGFYFILEGVSGVGKNTVAEAIRGKLSAAQVPNTFIEEPSEKYRALRDQIGYEKEDFRDNLQLKKALYMADRAYVVERALRPSLNNGEVVTAVRSCMSTAVYQSQDHADAYRTLTEHDWVPTCDLLVLLDTDVETALSRINKRSEPLGAHETAEQLAAHRELYLELAPFYPSRHTEIIDVSSNEEEVIEEVYSVLTRQLELRNG